MDGFRALDLRELVIEVLHSDNVLALGKQIRNESQSKQINIKAETKNHGNRENDELSNVDYVVTSAKPVHCEAMLPHFR